MPAPSDDMKAYQLLMTHVIAHPNFEAAVRDAVKHAGPAETAEVDAVASFKTHGIALPDGATAKFHPPKTESASDNGSIKVCILIGIHVYCAQWDPPIELSVDGS